MPPKAKPGSKKPTVAKKSTDPSKATNSASSSGNKNAETASGLTQEAEDQFELELCWCIQQLETCLAGKLSEKMAQDMTRSLNVLKSNMAPLVKKRQVMRNALGNYREKMALEEQKHGKTARSINFVSTAKQKEKYVFVKKAAYKSTKEKQHLDSDDVSANTNDDSVNNVETVFRFNFTIKE